MPTGIFKNSKERAKKISKKLKGNKNCLGKKNALGYKHTKEWKKRMSKFSSNLMKEKWKDDVFKIKMSKSQIGEKNYNWKGGITPENKRIHHSIEYRLWREAVFARDNWTCQKYGIKGGNLVAHHIQNFSKFPEIRFAIDNGITLSKKAHQEFHKKYGIKNNTKEQINEFLTTK